MNCDSHCLCAFIVALAFSIVVEMRLTRACSRRAARRGGAGMLYKLCIVDFHTI
jgi:hypothetical protein